MIYINIPTRWSEIREFVKTRIDKKYKHNKKLFDDLYDDIIDELKSGYWNKDISDYMKEQLTNPFNGKIYYIVLKYKKQVK